MAEVTPEVQTYLENPENKAALLAVIETDAVEYLKTKGHVVLKNEDYQAEKSSVFKTQAEEIDAEANELARELGLTRPANTPTSAWVKTVKAEAKKQLAETKAEARKKAEVASGSSEESKQLKAQLDAMKQDFESYKTTAQQEKEAAQRNLLSKTMEADLSTLRLAEKPEDARKAMDDLTLFINAKYKPQTDERGRVVYHDASGSPLMKSNGEPKTAADITKEFHPQFIYVEPVKQGGTGASGGVKEATDHVVASKMDDIYTALSKRGFPKGSKEYNEFKTKSIQQSRMAHGDDFKM
jgi:hypothetical protein